MLLRSLGLSGLLLLTLSQSLNAGPACKVDAQPGVSISPLRFIRVKATIEDRGGGMLFLVDEDDEITGSQIQPGARTTVVEWKNVVLGAGEYEVQLKTIGCLARARLEVHGNE